MLRGEKILYPVQILVPNVRLFGDNAEARARHITEHPVKFRPAGVMPGGVVFHRHGTGHAAAVKRSLQKRHAGGDKLPADQQVLVLHGLGQRQAFAARRSAEVKHLLAGFGIHTQRGKLAGKALYVEKPFFKGRACGGRTGKLYHQRPGPGAGRYGMALALQQRRQRGVVGAQGVHADGRFRLVVKGGDQRESLLTELLIKQLRYRAGQAVVRCQSVQRVGKVALANFGGSGAAQHGVDHARSAGLTQCLRQLDRFIHGGGQRHIHVSRLGQPRPQHSAYRCVQLVDRLFRELI